MQAFVWTEAFPARFEALLLGTDNAGFNCCCNLDFGFILTFFHVCLAPRRRPHAPCVMYV